MVYHSLLTLLPARTKVQARWCIRLFAGGSSGSTSIFRSFRLLRVLKLAKSINSLRVLLATVVECIGNVAYMTLLLFLFVFMFAVMGVQGACCCD